MPRQTKGSQEDLSSGDEIDAGSKALVWRLFGPELGDKMALAAGHGKTKKYRKVLEPTDAVTQCERSGSQFTPGMKCYLCGLPIPAKEDLTGSEDELYVECEHILPVTEARWFLDLYMARRPPTDPWTRRALALEYAQAHRVCNQAKSNYSFIATDAQGNPRVDLYGIDLVLEKIKKRAAKNVERGYGSKVPVARKLMNSIAELDVSQRREPIAERVREIGEHAANDPADAALTVLARTSMLVDPSAFPGPVRAEYDAWVGMGFAEREAMNRARLEGLRKQTYDAYPEIRPEALLRGLLRLLKSLSEIPLDEYEDLLSEVSVNRILDTYFDTITTEDPTGMDILDTVYYGLFRNLYSLMLARTPSPTRLLCDLYVRMKDLAIPRPDRANPGKRSETPPACVRALGPPPEVPSSVERDCYAQEVAARAEGRSMRKEAESTVTLDEVTNYYLGADFTQWLTRTLREKAGMNALLALQTARKLSQSIRDEFRNAKQITGMRDEDALNIAAERADGDIRIGFAGNPEVADRVATLVTEEIRTSRRGEGPSDYVPPVPEDTDVAPGVGAGAGSQGGNRTTRRALYG
jgi:hypothetical protein